MLINAIQTLRIYTVRQDALQQLSRILGRHSEPRPKCPVKAEVVRKTAGKARLGDAHAVFDGLLCEKQPFFGDVI